MILEDMSIIAGTYKNADGSAITMMQKYNAFQELDGYINGTDSRFSALTSAFDAKQKQTLKADIMNCLKNFNDVEMPVGQDKDGNPVFERIYLDQAQTQPATAADLLQAWEDTGANGSTKTQFYFSFTSDDIDMSKSKESWAGGTTASDMTPNACRDDGHDTYNPTGEAGGGVTVDEHREYSGKLDCDCHGDAQSIAPYCNFNHMNADGTDSQNFNYQASFDDYLKQNNWSGS